MPIDPPALPPRDRERPIQAGRTTSGGFPGIQTILLCLLLSGLAPCPGSAAQTAPAQEILAAAPANMPPFFVPAADGSPDGFAVELLRRVAAQAGYSLRIIPTTTIAEAEQLLRQGRVQAVLGLGISPAREQALGFTRPFELLPVHIFFRAAAPPLETLDSLAGKRLALVAGSIPAERLLDRPELSVQLTQTLAEAIFEVLSGHADALVFVAPVVQQAARSAGVEQILDRSKRPLFEVGRALAVERGNPQMLARLDSALGAFLETQEFRDIYRTWHPAPHAPRFPPVARWTMTALALALTIALLAWRAISLSRVNRRLKLAASERKQAEEALQEQNDENLTLLNGVPAMIFYKSLDNRILRANAAWFRVMGLDESILGLPLEQVYHRELAEKVRQDDLEVFESGQAKMNIQETIQTPSGLRRFTTHKLPRRDARGEITGLVCIATDVTDLYQAEAALAESAEEFRTLAEDSPALICRFLPGGILTYVNRAFCATFGRSAQELLGSSLLKLVPAEERAAILARLGSFTPAAPVAVAEQKVLLPDGRLGWQQWTDRALFDSAGGIIAYQSVGVDITALKQSEIDLTRLHRAIEQTAEGVLITDKDGITTYTNPALERMTGLCGAGRAPGLSVLEVRQTVLAHQDSVVRQDEGGGWRGTSSFARQSGLNVEVEFTISAIRDAAGEVISFVAVCRDVTEKRLLERQLWQAQKMEALGTLAGGIAHDFNNILASIMGFTELALDDTPPEGRARGSLARVLKASNRAKELVRQILTFSRRADREQRTLMADQIIGEALRLMEATLPKNIEITAQVQAQDCAILADPSQIHQIMMNLCTNAAQAMREGGRMAVRTRLAHLGEDAPAQARTLPPGRYLRLTVEDTGAGIAPDILGRIFDPFFTTKDSGEGTGLGLAVVHGIVCSLGGAIYAESEPGQGATFTVLLPTVAPRPTPAHHCGQASPANPKGRERILLVDDEADLLDLVAQTLEPLGYQVAAHNLPEDALRAFLASPKSFDLVLTDQSMPRLTGIQLVTRLREVRPDLPIVLCTGLSLVIPPDRFQALGQAWLLPKPFSTGELARVVRQALASNQGDAHAT